MDKKKIYCNYCSDEIKTNQDLTVTYSFVRTLPYHNECYGERRREAIVMGRGPVNGFANTIYAIISMILALFVLFSVDEWYFFVLFLLPPILKYYVWFKYERHL